MATNIENLVKIDLVLSAIFGEICQVLPYRLNSTNFSPRNLRCYGRQKFTNFVYDVDGSLSL